MVNKGYNIVRLSAITKNEKNLSKGYYNDVINTITEFQEQYFNYAIIRKTKTNISLTF